jgi:hypothetical protein
MVGAAAGLGAAVEQRIGGDHFRYRESGAQLLAQLAKRTIRHPGHGRDKQVVAQLKAEEVHVGMRMRVGEGAILAQSAFGGNRGFLLKR